MSASAIPDELKTVPRPSAASRRHWIDSALMKVFSSGAVRRALRDQHRLNLAALGEHAFRAVELTLREPTRSFGAQALTTHRRLVLIDPSRKGSCSAGLTHRLPFDTPLATNS